MKNFNKKKIETIHLSKIFGGGDWINTKSVSKRTIGGQEVSITTDDTFHDANGDKQWSTGESGAMCQTIN